MAFVVSAVVRAVGAGAVGVAVGRGGAFQTLGARGAAGPWESGAGSWGPGSLQHPGVVHGGRGSALGLTGGCGDGQEGGRGGPKGCRNGP